MSAGGGNLAEESRPQQEFENGAEVLLKSGSPVMTVAGFDKYNFEWQYQCRWWDQKKQSFQTELFYPHELKRYSSGGRSVIERG
jgi:uncharacterized protein YodC (DUF2158 family)